MALKRKFDSDSPSASRMDDDDVRMPKHLKLIPFPGSDTDEDSAMIDAESLFNDQVHTRIPSNASTASTCSDYSPTEISPVVPVAYPTLELYPASMQFTGSSLDSTQLSPSVGLIQPKSGFAHHGSGCTTIPRLRVACSTSAHGERRSMYTLCESCGAISMVDCD